MPERVAWIGITSFDVSDEVRFGFLLLLPH